MMEIDWSFIFSERVLSAIAAGLQVTVLVSLYGGLGACLIGLAIGLLQVSQRPWPRRIGQTYVALFRNIPLLVQLFFWYFGIPVIFPPSEFPVLYSGSFEVHIAAFTIALVSGAFVAEVVRSGVEAIPIGQWEAGFATGLSRGQIFGYVVAPQLAPVILPGLSNEVLNVVKSTAFAMTIGLPELTWQAQAIEAETFRGFEAMTAVTLTYLILSLLILQFFRGLELLLARK